VVEATAPARYSLSFTSGALLMHEASIAVPLYTEDRDWALVRRRIEAENLLQARTVSSGLRRTQEITKRLAALSDAEIDFFLDASLTERGYLLWVAACRRYTLIGEFADEVLRERFLVMATTVTYEDFDVFLRSRAMWHEEVANLKESTANKLRGNVFRMLTDTGLVSDTHLIVSPILSNSLVTLLTKGNPSDLRFFPVVSSAQSTKAG
jgi:hypothetical protein